MAENQSTTCTIPDELLATFRKFKLGKDVENVAFIMKINPKTLTVEMDEVIKSIQIGDLGEELPEATPRYIAYSYCYVHKDGRKSYPLVFIYYCPPCSTPSLNMMYASTKQRLANALQIQKLFDVKEVEEINEDWLKTKLAFFS